MFCKFCGTPIPTQSQYCPNCGKANGVAVASSSHAPAKKTGMPGMPMLLLIAAVIGAAFILLKPKEAGREPAETAAVAKQETTAENLAETSAKATETYRLGTIWDTN